MSEATYGLEGLLAAIGGRKVGLTTGPTGWLGKDGHLIDALHWQGLLQALFAPEHGVWGDLQAGVHVEDGADPRTGVTVHSLYGKAKEPTAAMLDRVEVMVSCFQDAGARPYTFKDTVAACARSAADHGLPLIILDRPTPLKRGVIQGNVGEGGFWFPVGLPMRPGITMGEHIKLYAHEADLDLDLTLVPLLPGEFNGWFDETDLPWLPPSPNLPTLTSALLFGATVPLEGTNASEGRGTTTPFEMLGAPWCDGHRLADELNGRGIPGILARACYFEPTFSKHRGDHCGGVQLHVTDRDAVDPPLLGVHVLDALLRLFPEDFNVRDRSLDARFNGSDVREALEAGEHPDAIADGWVEGIEGFKQRCAEAGVTPDWSSQ